MEINSCSRFVAPRRAFARLVLCLGFAFAGVMALAAAEEAGKRSYDIPAGNAADALKQFSEQSGRGVMANGDLVKGIRTNSVKGEHAPVDALELLLADTGLVAIPDTKSGAFSIRKETAIEAKNVNRAIAESGRPNQSVTIEKIGGEEVVKMPDYTRRLSLCTQVTIKTVQRQFVARISGSLLDLKAGRVYLGHSDGPLKWRYNMGLDFTHGNWSFCWTMQYYDGYSVKQAALSEASNKAFVASQGSERIVCQSYHDLAIRYKNRVRGHAIWSNCEVVLGVQNVLDKSPPVAARINGSVVTSYSFYGDPRLCRYSFSVSKQF